MNLKRILNLGAVAALAGTLAFAQNTPAPQEGQGRPHAAIGQRLAAALNLTPDQQQQARSIFSAARQSAQPIHTQMRDARQQLMAAIKSGAPESDIDRLSAQVGTLSGQLTAVRSKAFEKFYSILTPDQQGKVDQKMMRLMSAGFRHRGARRFQPQQN